MADIGHNLPTEPPEALIARIIDLENVARSWPDTITSDEQERQLSDVVTAFRKLLQQIEADCEVTKEPYYSAYRKVLGLYRVLTDRVTLVKHRLDGVLIRYKQAKREAAEKAAREAAEAERKRQDELRAQTFEAPHDGPEVAPVAPPRSVDVTRARGDLGSVTSLKQYWTGELADRATLDLGRLRPHLDTEALEKAIRAYAKYESRDKRTPPPLRGATIYQKDRL